MRAATETTDLAPDLRGQTAGLAAWLFDILRRMLKKSARLSCSFGLFGLSCLFG